MPSTLAHSETKMTKILLRSILGVFIHVRYLTPIKLSSVRIRMLPIQLPRVVLHSLMVGTHNRLDISYSRLVGGLPASLGRRVSTWIHNGTVIGLLSPESAVMLGLGSHILFRREYYRLETSQPQQRPSSTISLPPSDSSG